MPYKNLSSFVQFLESKNQLHRVKVEVDPVLEVTEIAGRVGDQQGPAILFERVKGSPYPILVNVMRTAQRLNWALGRTPVQVGEEIKGLADSLMPPSPKKIWSKRKSISRILAMRPRPKKFPPIGKHLIQPADLDQLPISQTWPDDGGKFITFPLVVTRSPDDGKQNMGVYRMHVYNKYQTGMHWQIGKGGGYHYQIAEAQNQPLPVAVVVGADPILMMCGVLPLPEGLDEMTFSGFLRGKATRTTRLPNGLTVPAEAEFILEGHVPPHERRMEGPFGDHFGHYSHAAEFPIFNVRQIHHRPNPIFPIALVGKPPQEDQVIGDAVQEMLLPLLKIMHPEIVDMWAYQEAGFHNLLVIKIKERFKKESIKTALWALGEGQLALTKIVVVVDGDTDARNYESVMEAMRHHFDPIEDFILLPATSQDTLDFTSFKMNLGSKMVLDATGRGQAKSTPPAQLDEKSIRSKFPEITDTVLLGGTFLIVKTAGPGRAVLEKMITLPEVAPLKMIAVVSEDIPLDNPILRLWGVFTRFDCARDVFFANVELKNGHPVYKGPMAIDATFKKGYPDPVAMKPEVVELVDRRWPEYGFKF